MDDRDAHSPNRGVGINGETAARQYLSRKGYRWLDSNYRTRLGEIDLVMRDRDAIVFVEVKRRRNANFGDPEEAITPGKIKHLIRTALSYLVEKGLSDQAVRFDVITIGPEGVKHYENAFPADGDYFY